VIKRVAFGPGFFLVIAAINLVMASLDVGMGHWFQAFNFGAFAVVWIMFPILRAGWQRSTALVVRLDVLHAAREAHDRGMTFDEWYAAEAERTFGNVIT
jgi:hypothetical protein